MVFQRQRDLIESNLTIFYIFLFANSETANFYIVSDLYGGGDLFDFLEAAGHLPEEDVKIIMNKLLSCVKYLHNNCNMVHRDLKLENILLDSSRNLNELKLIDFGLALRFNPKDTEQTFYELVGSTAYVAPQVIEGSYTAKCDLWSCGVIAYVLLAGFTPFDAWDDGQILQQILIGQIDFEDEVWGPVSDTAKDFVCNLLAYNEEDRPTADQALTHPWLEEFREKKMETEKDKKLIDDSIRDSLMGLRRFRSKGCKLKQAVCAIMASQLIKREEKEIYTEGFRFLNPSLSGSISKDDLRQTFRVKAGLKHVSDEVIDKMFVEVNFSGSGEITYSEYAIAMMFRQNMIGDDKLHVVFDMLDKDGDGKISSSDLEAVLELPASACKKMIKQVDVVGNGKIPFDQFKNAVFSRVNLDGSISMMDTSMLDNSSSRLDGSTSRLDDSIGGKKRFTKDRTQTSIKEEDDADVSGNNSSSALLDEEEKKDKILYFEPENEVEPKNIAPVKIPEPVKAPKPAKPPAPKPDKITSPKVFTNPAPKPAEKVAPPPKPVVDAGATDLAEKRKRLALRWSSVLNGGETATVKTESAIDPKDSSTGERENVVQSRKVKSRVNVRMFSIANKKAPEFDWSTLENKTLKVKSEEEKKNIKPIGFNWFCLAKNEERQGKELKEIEAEKEEERLVAKKAKEEAEAAEKARLEEAERQVKEEEEAAERARLEMEETARKARENAEAAERKRLEKEAARKAREEAEAAEHARLEKEEAERKSREEAEAAERARLEAEEKTRREVEAEQQAAMDASASEGMDSSEMDASKTSRSSAERKARKTVFKPSAKLTTGKMKFPKNVRRANAGEMDGSATQNSTRRGVVKKTSGDGKRRGSAAR